MLFNFSECDAGVLPWRHGSIGLHCNTGAQVTNCYHYPSSRYPGPIETLSREIFSSPKIDLHIVRVNDTSSFVISAFSALHTILLHTTNSAAILMISIIVKSGKDLTSKVY